MAARPAGGGAAQPRGHAASAGATSDRKGKQFNRVVFDLKATISPVAEATFAAMLRRYGPSTGNSFTVTHGQAVGPDLWVRITYTVAGGEKADVRRNLARCLRDASAELVGDELIEVLSREVLEDDLTG